MRDATTLTLAEVYALVADIDVTTFEWSCPRPPFDAQWSVAVRTCSDMRTAVARLKAQGIKHQVSDEQATLGRMFRGVVRTTAWDGPGCRWSVIHVHHAESPCVEPETVADPEQDALPIGEGL